jgi:hypothetical protein
MIAMQMLKYAARPALLAVVWMIASAHTLSELTSVGPALRSTTVVVSQADPPANRPGRSRMQASIGPVIAR